jgi:hypothetical protein
MDANITAYDKIFTLPPITIIGGSDKKIKFTLSTNENNIAIGGGGWCFFYPYSDIKNYWVESPTTIVPSESAYYIEFTLSAGQTYYLSGKYIYQVVLCNSDYKLTMRQGILTILPGTNG